MIKLLAVTLLSLLIHGYPIDPVSFTSVKVTDAFWGQRLKIGRAHV